MSTQSPIRIGLIGLGRHLMRSLLPNILATPELAVAAVCDLDEQKTVAYGERFPGVALLSSAEELLEQSHALGLQAVIISLSPTGHVQWTEAALRRGLHVLVEKPASFTSAELLPLADLAERQRLVTMVGTMWRYTVGIQLFQNWQRQQPGARAVRHLSLDATFPAAFARAGWDVPMLALPFYDMFLHGIDCSTALLGAPQSLRAVMTGQVQDGQTLEQPATVTVVLTYPSGALGVLNLHVGSHRYHTDVNLALADGSYVTIHDLTRLSVTTSPTWSGTEGGLRDHPTLDWEPGQMYRGYARHGYIEELRCFVEAVQTGEPTPTHLRAAAQTMAVLEACLQSLQQRDAAAVAQVL